MELQATTEETVTSPSISTTRRKRQPEVPVVLERGVGIQQWATDRLSRSSGLLETLGAYINIELNKGHELDTASRFEQGFLEFRQRPIRV